MNKKVPYASIEDLKNKIVQWVKDWFAKNGGPETYAVIGLSGGKDSCLCGKILVEALGKERVIGVFLPNGMQSDIDVSKKIAEYLGVKTYEVNIKDGNSGILDAIFAAGIKLSNYAKTNTPARVRMATLYAIAGTVDGRVCNTCNLSENYVGYATKYGDAAGDFAPIDQLTVREVKALAYEFGIPAEFVEKVPSDGLCGKSDEESFGFTYDALDTYLLEGKGSAELIEKIEKMKASNLHKLSFMETFDVGRVIE